jgi:hypothetical protein
MDGGLDWRVRTYVRARPCGFLNSKLRTGTRTSIPARSRTAGCRFAEVSLCQYAALVHLSALFHRTRACAAEDNGLAGTENAEPPYVLARAYVWPAITSIALPEIIVLEIKRAIVQERSTADMPKILSVQRLVN